MSRFIISIYLILTFCSFSYAGQEFNFYSISDGNIMSEPNANSKIVKLFEKWEVFCDAELNDGWIVLRKMELEQVEKTAWVYWRNRNPITKRPSIGEKVNMIRINENWEVIDEPYKRFGTIIKYTGRKGEVKMFGSMIFNCEEVIYHAKEPIEHYVDIQKVKRIGGECYKIKNKMFLIKTNPDWPDDFINLILNNKIAFGMSEDQVKAAWGIPNDINISSTNGGTHSQWIYNSNYVYFINGIVDAIQ